MKRNRERRESGQEGEGEPRPATKGLKGNGKHIAPGRRNNWQNTLDDYERERGRGRVQSKRSMGDEGGGVPRDFDQNNKTTRQGLTQITNRSNQGSENVKV